MKKLVSLILALCLICLSTAVLAESANITLAEVNTEAKLEDFAGEWVCKYVAMAGKVVDVTAIPVEQLGASQIPGMKIEGNTMILTGLESMTGEDPLEMEFADGALSLDLGKMLADAAQAAGMDLSSLGLDGLQMTLGVMLLKDGMAGLYINAMGQEIAFIFEPAPAAAETPAA